MFNIILERAGNSEEGAVWWAVKRQIVVMDPDTKLFCMILVIDEEFLA
jgi:hypothetical protein